MTLACFVASVLPWKQQQTRLLCYTKQLNTVINKIKMLSVRHVVKLHSVTLGLHWMHEVTLSQVASKIH